VLEGAFESVVNAAPLADQKMLAEWDGVHSHGLCMCREKGMEMTTFDFSYLGLNW